MRIRVHMGIFALATAMVTTLTLALLLVSVFNLYQRARDTQEAELVISQATELRQIAVDTVLFHEARAQDQWQRKIKDLRAHLRDFSGSSETQATFNLYITKRLDLAETVYQRIIQNQGDKTGPEVNAALEARTISALFVITQEMLDFGSEQVRLNRQAAAVSLTTSYAIIALLLLIFGGAAVMAWRLVKRSVLTPVREIELGTQRIASGDLSHRLSLVPNNELGELAKAFNTMTAQVQKSHAELRKLALLATHTDNAVIVTDADGVIEWVNAGFTRITGHQRDEVLGLKPGAFLHGAQTNADTLATIGMAQRRGERIETEILNYTKEGRAYWAALVIEPIHDDTGQLIHFMAIESDITERKRKDKELSRLTERLKIATEAARVGIWEFDAAARASTWDEMMFPLYGVTRATYPSADHAWRAAMHPEDKPRYIKQLAQAIKGTHAFNTSYRVLWPSGQVHWIHAVGSAERDSSGKALRMIGTNWDITEEKKADLAKSAFVATVSHELRTPLTSINGSIGLVMGGVLGAVPPNIFAMLSIARKNSERLAYLIDDLLDIEKLAAGKVSFRFQPQALMPLVEQTIESTRAYGLKLKVAFQLLTRADEVMVNVDGSRLQQVLANLLSNAAKFSPLNSAVEITVSTQATSVRVTVRDYGTGIPAEFQAHVFEKFSQADASDARKQVGTGLGLAIAKELIEHMNGRIGFDSMPGQGTRFYIDIPLWHPQPT